MRRPRLLAATSAMVAVFLVLRACGCAEHASVLAGMPRSEISWAIGPMYVIAELHAVVVAPIVMLACLTEHLVDRLRA